VNPLLNLIQNENMKIYRRIRTWILLGILVTLAVVVVYFIHRDAKIDNSNVDWKSQLQQEIAFSKENLALMNDEKFANQQFKQRLEKEIKVNEYRLENNIPPYDKSVWSYVLSLSQLISLVTVFTSIIAADIMAAEFAGGTIKLLLIRPTSRTKILLSKYLATLGFSILLLATLFLTSFITAGLFTGFENAGESYIYASKDLVVHEIGMFVHAINTYALECLQLVMIVTLAFMISVVFRSSALAIGISLFAMFIGAGITVFIQKYSWAKYYLFANTDLTQYINGQPYQDSMTMGFSIAVLIGYFVIFHAISWFVFTKRDVAA
jgi:ABC-2 type transport system permease protein